MFTPICRSVLFSVFLVCGSTALLSAEDPAPVCVFELGAKGDGQVDDSAALQAAIDAAHARGVMLHLPPGTFLVRQSLRIPSNFALQGSGVLSTVLLTEQSPAFNVIDIADVEQVQIRNLRLIEKGHLGGGVEERAAVLTEINAWKNHGYRASGAGVGIHGSSRDILVEGVYVTGFRTGFSLGREEPSRLEAITLRDCKADWAVLWGFEINNCESALLDNVQSYHHRLDGIKGRKRARNLTIRGGESAWCVAGDGYDGYAGSGNLLIDGLIAHHNGANGIYIKSGPLHFKSFGPVGQVDIRGVRCIGNKGRGLDINRSGGDVIKSDQEQLPPLAYHFTVSGGVFEKNHRSGIYVRGQSVAISGVVSSNNGEVGIDLTSAWDVDVSEALVSDNSQNNPGVFPAIQIGVDPVKATARNVTIRGGAIFAHGVGERKAGDVPALPTVYHEVAVRIGAAADRVLVKDVLFNGYDERSPVVVEGWDSARSIVVHYGPRPRPEGPGSAGSMLISDGKLWFKQGPAHRTDGWFPLQPTPAD